MTYSTIEETIALAKEMMDDETIRSIAFRVKADGDLTDEENQYIYFFEENSEKNNILGKIPGPSFYLCRLAAGGHINSVHESEAIKILKTHALVAK
jgi:hypothetical protein